MPTKTINDLERDYYLDQLGLDETTGAMFSINDLKRMFFSDPPAGGGGGATNNGRIVTAETVITADDDTVVLNGADPIHQPLPAASSVTAWKPLRIVNIGSGASTISSTISDAASSPLPQYESLVVMSTGTEWVLVSSTNKQQLALKAPIASPVFTGTVTIPTPSGNSEPATKLYVDQKQAENWPNQATQAIRIVGVGTTPPGTGNENDLYISTNP